MTIRQQGGVFGRNPKFNDVEASSVTISSENNPVLLAERTANTADIDLIDPQSTARIRNVAGRVQLYADANNERADSGFRFYVDNVRLVDIDTNGNIVFNSSGQGIDFSATSGTGTSELFDDYEEGYVSGVVLTPTTGTITTRSGYGTLAYTKKGREVSVQGMIGIGGTSSPTGNISFPLPFAVASLTEFSEWASGTAVWRDDNLNTWDHFPLIATSGSTGTIQMDPSVLATYDYLLINLTYIAA